VVARINRSVTSRTAVDGPAGISKTRLTFAWPDDRTDYSPRSPQRCCDRQLRDDSHRIQRGDNRRHGQQRDVHGQRRGSKTKKCRFSGICGIRLRMRSSRAASAKPSGSEISAADADNQRRFGKHVETTRHREKPRARSAAISPSRWLTDTVSSTVMSSSANETVTVVSTVEICRK
jgi:hypothetical protein